MTPLESIGSPLLWGGFLLFVLGLLGLDLGVFHRKAHAVSTREAAIWSGVWVGLALLFNAGVYWVFGAERALEFSAGYLIEKALSIDNIFVFVVIFGAFGVPAQSQHRVLFWGVLGALVLRAVVIVVGGALIARFHSVLYLFGGLLVLAGLKLLWRKEEEAHPEQNPILRAFRRWVPVADGGFAPDQFFVRRAGRRLATPLFFALVAVEVTDLVFAVDSIPAVFAVTTDPFIVFSSNVFAILGLRSMYFLLAAVISRFAYLKIGLALVLVFVGAKMLLAGVYVVPIVVSLGVIVFILGASIVVSLLVTGGFGVRERGRRAARVRS